MRNEVQHLCWRYRSKKPPFLYQVPDWGRSVKKKADKSAFY